MNSQTHSAQKDFFSVPTAGLKLGPLFLYLKRIPAPRRMGKEDRKGKPRSKVENFHVPSFKNSKVLITKDPRGFPLKRPMLITAPEYQRWMRQAVENLESQLLSMCQTGTDGIQRVHSKLFAMCSRLPADDSCNDLVEISIKVVRVPPGEEGAEISLERLNT